MASTEGMSRAPAVTNTNSSTDIWMRSMFETPVGGYQPRPFWWPPAGGAPLTDAQKKEIEEKKEKERFLLFTRVLMK